MHGRYPFLYHAGRGRGVRVEAVSPYYATDQRLPRGFKVSYDSDSDITLIELDTERRVELRDFVESAAAGYDPDWLLHLKDELQRDLNDVTREPA